MKHDIAIMLLFSNMFQQLATFFAIIEILFFVMLVFYSLNFSHCKNVTMSYKSNK